MIDKEIAKQALESIRKTCEESPDCWGRTISHMCPRTAQIPSEWTDEEIEEVLK